MAWPPPALAINRSNATPSQDTHPQDHNAVNLAVNDIVGQLVNGTIPDVDMLKTRMGVGVHREAQPFTTGQQANFSAYVEDYDPQGFYTGAGDTIVVPALTYSTGIYSVSAGFKTNVATTGLVDVYVTINGAIAVYGYIMAGKYYTTISRTMYVAAGYQISVGMYNGGTGSVSVSAYVDVVKVAP